MCGLHWVNESSPFVCHNSLVAAEQAEMKILDKAINVERERRKQEYQAELLRQKIEADNARTQQMASEKAKLQKERQENAKRILYVKHHLSSGGGADPDALLDGFGDRCVQQRVGVVGWPAAMIDCVWLCRCVLMMMCWRCRRCASCWGWWRFWWGGGMACSDYWLCLAVPLCVDDDVLAVSPVCLMLGMVAILVMLLNGAGLMRTTVFVTAVVRMWALTDDVVTMMVGVVVVVIVMMV